MNSVHYNSLDGLRGIAAYTVVISHFSIRSGILGGVLGNGAGQIGVMLFFVLSGFLMARLYFDKPISAVGEFALKRVARVLPLYLAVVAASYFWVGEPFYPITDANLIHHLLFIDGVGVLWTIAVELQFYALFPLVWLTYRQFGKTGLAVSLFAVLVVLFTFEYPNGPVVLRHLHFFVFGIVVAQLPTLTHQRASDLAFVALAFIYVITLPGMLALIGVDVRPIWNHPLYMFSVPVLLFTCLSSSLANKILGSAPLRFLGGISYSVYLLHIPVLLTLLQFQYLRQNVWVFAVVFLVATTFIACLSFLYFENQMRRWVTSAMGFVRRLA